MILLFVVILLHAETVAGVVWCCVMFVLLPLAAVVGVVVCRCG